ncbi:DUF4157 domain-containing protein [Flavobacterium salilacus subsp. salilacus]|uniref:eCIS core domain-containing protein n=1 Tax=Flavobacterium TaxID=237 RepID=UPI00107501DA|nr:MULTISPECIES: DUF4157 domain-containing protein [Flavobacterium]KAF2517483.1 DUF4157 domain-containing protein [Flavobacterium salilacus subsp. salilacus]MBE1615627.1 DUF4157 domain-containing protein [Flavobacterium sp. SaA2.13]
MEHKAEHKKTNGLHAANAPAQRKSKAVSLEDNRTKVTAQKKPNNTGLPDNLKSGIENLSGHSMDDVKVHYNSAKPAQLNAHAYAQGTDIHIASGQEKHLPHEAWHVVQQKQGRVKPTMQMKDKVTINDDRSLEKEADVMGGKAVSSDFSSPLNNNNITGSIKSTSIQRLVMDGKDKIGRLHLSANLNTRFEKIKQRAPTTLELSELEKLTKEAISSYRTIQLTEIINQAIANASTQQPDTQIPLASETTTEEATIPVPKVLPPIASDMPTSIAPPTAKTKAPRLVPKGTLPPIAATVPQQRLRGGRSDLKGLKSVSWPEGVKPEPGDFVYGVDAERTNLMRSAQSQHRQDFGTHMEIGPKGKRVPFYINPLNDALLTSISGFDKALVPGKTGQEMLGSYRQHIESHEAAEDKSKNVLEYWKGKTDRSTETRRGKFATLSKLGVNYAHKQDHKIYFGLTTFIVKSALDPTNPYYGAVTSQELRHFYHNKDVLCPRNATEELQSNTVIFISEGNIVQPPWVNPKYVKLFDDYIQYIAPGRKRANSLATEYPPEDKSSI